MELHEKQEHFEYRNPDDLYVHGEPFSPEKWNAELVKIAGRCPFGDARMRIVWGGTAKKRSYVQTDLKSVETMTIKYPGPIPKIQQLVGFVYFNADGQRVEVVKHEDVPKSCLAIPRYEYFELGMLRWILEHKYTPEELIAIGRYPDPATPEGKMYGVRGNRRYVAPMDSKGEYVALYPLQTPDGLYWEPDEGWFVALKKTKQDIDSITEGQRQTILNQYLDRIEEAERKQKQADEEAEEAMFEETLIEVEKGPQGQVIFT